MGRYTYEVYLEGEFPGGRRLGEYSPEDPHDPRSSRALRPGSTIRLNGRLCSVVSTEPSIGTPQYEGVIIVNAHVARTVNRPGRGPITAEA